MLSAWSEVLVHGQVETGLGCAPALEKKERCPPAIALSTSQTWLRDTTNQEKVQDLRSGTTSSDHYLLSLIRSLQLRDPNGRSYRHPSDWAGMSYHGS